MLKTRIEKTYQKFPYRAEFDNERTNIGGIDLTREPYRIDEIRELDGLPKTRQAIYELNKQNTAFMTLGCAFGDLDIYWGGYLEICFRPSINTQGLDIMRLDELFFENLAKHCSPELCQYMGKATISWEIHYARVHESDLLPIVAIFFGARSEHDLDLTVELFVRRVHQDFLYLV